MMQTIAELQDRVSEVQARPPPEDGPKLHALQQELAALEEQNQKLQIQLERGGSSRSVSPSPQLFLNDTHGRDSDLRRANVIIDIKSQEISRLKEELELTEGRRRESEIAAISMQQQLNAVMGRLEMAEKQAAGAGMGSGNAHHAMHRSQLLEQERSESEQAMRELITETNGKAKTIADLLALQEDMVSELDGMRRDLTRMGQQKDALDNEKRVLEETVSRYHMMGTQKEILEAEKQQLEEALYRYGVKSLLSRNHSTLLVFASPCLFPSIFESAHTVLSQMRIHILLPALICSFGVSFLPACLCDLEQPCQTRAHL